MLNILQQLIQYLIILYYNFLIVNSLNWHETLWYVKKKKKKQQKK